MEKESQPGSETKIWGLVTSCSCREKRPLNNNILIKACSVWFAACWLGLCEAAIECWVEGCWVGGCQSCDQATCQCLHPLWRERFTPGCFGSTEAGSKISWQEITIAVSALAYNIRCHQPRSLFPFYAQLHLTTASHFQFDKSAISTYPHLSFVAGFCMK